MNWSEYCQYLSSTPVVATHGSSTDAKHGKLHLICASTDHATFVWRIQTNKKWGKRFLTDTVLEGVRKFAADKKGGHIYLDPVVKTMECISCLDI